MSKCPIRTQKFFFNAATANAFTTVLAGLAFTIITLPKTSLLPALVAGFWRVLIMHKPGKTNFPALFTSLVAMAARLSMIFAASAFLISIPDATSASARPPLVIGLAPAFIPFMALAFIAFIAFIGAMVKRLSDCSDGGV